ncbi:hypothetical protein J8J04_00540 ['Fragaria x ananassa' phyllody phytoplasma]|uniref:Uncharacterized protein n=1 Tax='Fragaria x ananassa' phyllody phytoplasma TaxID=2358428 RepID=A0ABS5K4P7_9MOLU|nr:hypothetical protein ['Fragaria x ananassa' phyllody phytoplasma]MBS2126208.1 hypothetical protein ['Fragaria x ananassa' phyllody phytoplasma]
MLIIIFVLLVFLQNNLFPQKLSLSLPNVNYNNLSDNFHNISQFKTQSPILKYKQYHKNQNLLKIKTRSKRNKKEIKKIKFFKPVKSKNYISKSKIELLNTYYDKNKPKLLSICQQFSPQLESQIQDMNVWNIYLGSESQDSKALEWLKNKFINRHFVKNFRYGIYNDQIYQSYVCFNSLLENPLPEKLLLIYFDEGTRKNTSNCYSLEALKNLGNGAKNMYIFWKDEIPISLSEANFLEKNFYTDIVYEKVADYNGPSYVNIESILLKKLDNNEIVAKFPIKCQIKAPFSLYNYDLQLRFPYYKYKSQGFFWKTRKIQKLRKVDLYAMQTGEKRTLYYNKDKK